MIYIASDHAWFEMKNKIIDYLKNKKIKFEDIWPYEYVEDDDYPDYIIPCAEKVTEDLEHNLWIILWGSWQGEAIAANKIIWIRAVVYYWWNKEIIKLSKLHNNSNILSLWARFIEENELIEIIKLWLETEFIDKWKHLKRIEKISHYENKKC